jgi:hypothetical protein
MLVFALAGAVLLSAADTVERAPVGPRDAPAGFSAAAADTTPRRKRAKAIELSDEYNMRLQIHKIASYATLPLFAVEYFAGEALFKADTPPTTTRPEWARMLHAPVGVALGGLFAVNTVTGAWNWWETRGDEKGRTWRTVHSVLMLVSDAGFAYTGSLASNAKHFQSDRNLHKNWAIGSMAVSLVSYAMMLGPIRQDK